jgi:hypothetical protein
MRGRRAVFEYWLRLPRLALDTMHTRMFFICSMIQNTPQPDKSTTAPQGFRDALAELVQIGLRVARMVGRIADAETALAEAASQAGAAEGVSALANSLAEAIEADQASAAAAEARHSVVARTEAVAGAFALVSRSVRLTLLLAERLDRGWARGGEPDDRHAKALRQIARGVADATEAENERTRSLTGMPTERLEALDTEAGIGNRSAEEIISEICRTLGLDPVRMIFRSPLPEASHGVEAGGTAPFTDDDGKPSEARPLRRPPDD